jgi:hypothetical protein
VSSPAGASPGGQPQGGPLPDGPLIGYRRWRVDKRGRLRSLGRRQEWPVSGPLTGRCRRHARPVLACSCGIYAYKQPVPACRCDDPAHPAHGAVGVVRLWGPAVEHRHGWRARHVAPVAVVDFSGRLSERYAVPRYRDLATMHAEWAPDLTPTTHEAAEWCGGPPADLPMPPRLRRALNAFGRWAVQGPGTFQWLRLAVLAVAVLGGLALLALCVREAVRGNVLAGAAAVPVALFCDRGLRTVRSVTRYYHGWLARLTEPLTVLLLVPFGIVRAVLRMPARRAVN